MGDADESVWRARVGKTIGAAVETLVTRSADGIEIAPLYPRRQDAVALWRKRPAWAVAQRIDHPDAEAANATALAELEGGADALTLVFAGSPFARGFGLSRESDLDEVFRDVELDFIDVRLDAGADTPAVAAALAALVTRRTLTSAALQIDLGFDPVGVAARAGTPVDLGQLPDVLAAADSAGLAGCPLLVDGRAWHEAGAGEALELAAVLATGVAYLHALESSGLALDLARKKVAVLLAADAEALLGLAKVRAMRRLWARVEAASGLTPRPLRLHAETSWRMMTRRDPWTNVMRATAATFAAGLGGADAVTVLPMPLPLGLPDEPARRLARNVQRVLLDESNLAMVDDPAGGSGSFEALTDALCETAWRLFQEIEAEGGIAASLAAGALQRRLAEAAA
ncbi:MAG: methylmalonyl-CoA mutase family protein, partial [Beijerinckiaceae bacterium]|nr:methylmalonyl-CoA mutase family protein [Beijerinckiaceae bacterium]